MDNTAQRVSTVHAIVITVAETVRELREVPSGVLYAALLGHFPSVTASEFEVVLATLKRSKLIEESGHVLTWIGPNWL